MKIVTKEYEVYEYSELSEKAKEKAKQWYLYTVQDAKEFTDAYMEELRLVFPDSSLKLQYSLSYCQGDGLNIYGKLDIIDFLSTIKGNPENGDFVKEFEHSLTEKEIKTIEAYMEECGREVELPYNIGYCYCIADKTDFAEDWICELKYRKYKNIQVDTIRKLEDIVKEMFKSLATRFEKYGYEYFYEVSDEQMEEMSEANEWTFLADGTIFEE